MLGCQPDGAQQLGHAFALPPKVQAVQMQRLCQDAADRHARVERGERVLEDDLHAPALRPQRGGIQRAEVLAFEVHAAGRRLDQPQYQPAERGLAAARLAHHAERLSGLEREVHAVHRLHGAAGTAEQPVPDSEVLGQPLHLEQRCAGAHAGSSDADRASSASASSGAFQQAAR